MSISAQRSTCKWNYWNNVPVVDPDTTKNFGGVRKRHKCIVILIKPQMSIFFQTVQAAKWARYLIPRFFISQWKLLNPCINIRWLSMTPPCLISSKTSLGRHGLCEERRSYFSIIHQLRMLQRMWHLSLSQVLSWSSWSNVHWMLKGQNWRCPAKGRRGENPIYQTLNYKKATCFSPMFRFTVVICTGFIEGSSLSNYSTGYHDILWVGQNYCTIDYPAFPPGYISCSAVICLGRNKDL